MSGWGKGKASGNSAWERRFQKFIKARTPRTIETTLNQKRIYIIPSKAGFGLLLVFALLMLLGINFQNNLVFMLAFWLLALLVVNILFTYRNLSGLVIRAVGGEPCFQGNRAHFTLEVSDRQGRARPGIRLGWPDEDEINLELQAGQTLQVQLSLNAEKRGWLVPPRIRIITRYPTGLARAWSYILPDNRAMVYPKPILIEQDTGSDFSQGDEDQGQEVKPGSTDFTGVRMYQPGDSLKQIHWPQLAKTGMLASREFVDYRAEDQWLDLNRIPGNDLEVKLSHLCARVITLYQQGTPWGLKLQSQILELGEGDLQRSQSLAMLALFGIDSNESTD